MKTFNIQPDATYFIDTNVWLYSFIQFQDVAKTESAKGIIKQCSIVISTQVVNEICVNLIRKVGFSEEKIRDLVESLYSKYAVFELSQDVLLKASEIRGNHNFSFWDSIVVASAYECEADYLLSEDMQDGFKLQDRLIIVNPFS